LSGQNKTALPITAHWRNRGEVGYINIISLNLHCAYSKVWCFKTATAPVRKPSDCAKTHPYCLKNFDLISGGADYIEGITGFA